MLASREEVLPFVYDWVELLAQDCYKEAFEMLLHPPDSLFTPDLVRQLMAGYGELERRDNKISRVTSPSTAVLPPDLLTHSQDVDWFDEDQNHRMKDRVGYVHFDIPLDGKWSDLTAVFWVHVVESGFVLELERIEVL